MSEKNSFQQQNKLIEDTINLRKKIISLNEDVKKTQEEIKKQIYKMLSFKKNSTKLTLNYLKDFIKKKEEEKQIKITNEEKNKKDKLLLEKTYFANQSTNNEKIFEQLVYLKNSIIKPNIDDYYSFTDQEETWIPELKKDNKNKKELNKFSNENISFYDLIHKKG